MTKMMTAIALALALPAAANAQAAPVPAPPPKAEQAGKMMDCKCCKDMAGMDHSKHDMAKPGADAPQAGQHLNHQK